MKYLNSVFKIQKGNNSLAGRGCGRSVRPVAGPRRKGGRVQASTSSTRAWPATVMVDGDRRREREEKGAGEAQKGEGLTRSTIVWSAWRGGGRRRRIQPRRSADAAEGDEDERVAPDVPGSILSVERERWTRRTSPWSWIRAGRS